VVYVRCRRSCGLLGWTLCLTALGAAAAARGEAQQKPGAAPAAIPSVLMTRDPSRPSSSRNVITKPAKQPMAVAVAASLARSATGAPAAGIGPTAAGTKPAAASGGPAAVSSDAHANIKVQGLTGTLNKGDIHQTMEARQELFDACIVQSQRRMHWVSGAIQFAFKVDAQGQILDVHPTTSNIGHRELEQCLTAAVAATQFPKPAGRANAEFGWGLSVEPAAGQHLDIAKPKIMATVMRKQIREVFDTCEIRRRRARFKITAYLAPGGHMLSAGALPLPLSADDKVDCVLDQLSKWHMPKVKRSSKVSFELR
jgi:outer membrane biosynthesis protein TonB